MKQLIFIWKVYHQASRQILQRIPLCFLGLFILILDSILLGLEDLLYRLRLDVPICNFVLVYLQIIPNQNPHRYKMNFFYALGIFHLSFLLSFLPFFLLFSHLFSLLSSPLFSLELQVHLLMFSYMKIYRYLMMIQLH